MPPRSFVESVTKCQKDVPVFLEVSKFSSSTAWERGREVSKPARSAQPLRPVVGRLEDLEAELFCDTGDGRREPGQHCGDPARRHGRRRLRADDDLLRLDVRLRVRQRHTLRVGTVTVPTHLPCRHTLRVGTVARRACRRRADTLAVSTHPVCRHTHPACVPTFVAVPTHLPCRHTLRVGTVTRRACRHSSPCRHTCRVDTPCVSARSLPVNDPVRSRTTSLVLCVTVHRGKRLRRNRRQRDSPQR